MSSNAIILVGGPSRGTRFRPLSLNCPKPLFPIAGKPLLYHHLAAISKVQGLKEVFLIGFFDDQVFGQFIERANQDFPGLHIRYLREHQALGTAGGIYHFKNEVLRNNPQYTFIMHSDIISSFPLVQLLRRHEESQGAFCTMLATRVPRDQTARYGCIVSNPATHEILHFVEKPSAFISDLINCGVYLFHTSDLDEIFRFKTLKDQQGEPHFDIANVEGSIDYLDGIGGTHVKGILRLEQDVLALLAGTKKLYVYETAEYWTQIKSASSAIIANSLVLQDLKKSNPSALTAESDTGPAITGAVCIDTTANVHPSAKIGPNVSIGPRVTVEAGVRIKDSIILDGAEIQANSCIIHSVVGWSSRVGSWARVEGTPNPTVNHHKLMENGQKVPSATILGQEVIVSPEVIIRNCIVLPHKELKSSYHNDILM